MESVNYVDQLHEELQYLNDLNEPQITVLVRLILKFLLNPSASDFQSKLGEFVDSQER
jgi:hypothetical protein